MPQERPALPVRGPLEFQVLQVLELRPAPHSQPTPRLVPAQLGQLQELTEQLVRRHPARRGSSRPT